MRLYGVVRCCALIATLVWPLSLAAQEPDPIEAFGTRASLQFATLSPDGARFAFVTPSEDGEYIGMVNLNSPTQEMHAIRVDGVVTDLEWVADERLAVEFIVLDSRNSFGSQDRNFYRSVIVSPNANTSTVTLGAFVYGETIEDLTPAEPDTFFVSAWSPIGSHAYSIFRVNPESGTPVRTYTGIEETGRWIMDGNGNLVARIDVLDDGAEDAILVPGEDGNLRRVGTLNDSRENSGWISGLTDNPNSLVVLSRRNEVNDALYEFNLVSGTWGERIFAAPEGDLAGSLRNDRTRRVIGATYYQDGSLHPHYFADADRQLQERIAPALGGRTIYILSRSLDGDRSVLLASSAASVPELYVFESSSGKLVPLGSTFPKLSGVTLGETRPHAYRASDGTELTGLLTLPPGREAANLPLIVIPAGGHPFENANFDLMSHFLANRGYAVLHAGTRQLTYLGELYGEGRITDWVNRSHADLALAITSLADEGIADKSRVCILGAHDNAYLAVMGAAITDDQYVCAIGIYGYYDLRATKSAVARTKSAYAILHSPFTRHWREYANDELIAYSPVSRADSITEPLLLLDSRSYGGYGPYYVGMEDLMRAVRRRDGDVVAINFDDTSSLEGKDLFFRMFTEIDRFLETRLGR